MIQPWTEAAQTKIATTVLHVRADASTPFETLYTAYRPFLRHLAVRKFNIPPADAEDLVQDVFATYLASTSSVRDVHPYLIGAICNAARHYRRRDAASPFCDAVPCGATPDDALMEEVVQSLTIASALAQLGPRCRETLERYYLLGEKAVDIARSRNQSANYISRLLNYCRNRARTLYQTKLRPVSR
jgi:RNA polymerase sigma factor (sigma-70 family)